ncbi:TPA: response regulator, partial [Candidatus Poribacteria bacterium]|nr:response regulator [Candidatus Poribacteria bacterium]HEX30052.1 response regulator [Candidatus Poribacteria bacterium]
MPLNILVVDDSSVMRSIISRTLILSGLPLGRIYQAANGKEGLQILDRTWVDLILVDINMPVMNGEEM